MIGQARYFKVGQNLFEVLTVILILKATKLLHIRASHGNYYIC